MNIDKTILLNKNNAFKDNLQLWWSKLKLKAALGHLGLLLTLMVYTTAGGIVFRTLEHPAEIERVSLLNTTLYQHRRHLMAVVVNSQGREVANLSTLLSSALSRYERALQDAVNGGVQIIEPVPPPITKTSNTSTKDQQDLTWMLTGSVVPATAAGDEDWSFAKAVFFSSTVITTIGYGNMVPRTLWGRVFCMCFALVGIPLTLTVIADWGRMFATAVSSLMKYLPSMPDMCKLTNMAHRRSFYAFASICFLFLYLAAGAGLFVIWEDDWTFFDGFYFCFVTMTTIGFGDLVPKQPKYMFLCTMYILIGLALTSTIIELVRRQYAHSWRRIQALSGPLAETLRRIGDAAGGGIAADVNALQQDLRKVLTVVSMPRWNMPSAGGGGGGNANAANKKDKTQKEWEEAVEAVIRDITVGTAQKQPPPLVQIVIYESSV